MYDNIIRLYCPLKMHVRPSPVLRMSMIVQVSFIYILRKIYDDGMYRIYNVRIDCAHEQTS
jgi:hypothetical protein